MIASGQRTSVLDLLLVRQRLYAWQLLPFQKFKRSAAAGGDVSDLVGYSGLVDSRDRVAATDDRDGRPVGRNSNGRWRLCPRRSGKLEDAGRTVPDNRARGRNHFLDGRDGLGANVQTLPVGGKIDRAIPRLGFGVGGKLIGQDVIDGQQQPDALGLAFSMAALAMSILSSSTRLLPVATPSARWKVYAMPPTMTSVSTLSSKCRSRLSCRRSWSRR